VLSGSTATVIGAMIVAPLMGPIMATAAAVVLGSSFHALRSLGLVTAGVVAVVVFSWMLTLIVPDVSISFTENAEIASRISPGLLALLTALGSGAAGAYITTREEIADSIGGVAIAISLVPPLCVVGISLSQSNWEAAAGSMILFLTNFLAILLAGGIVFMICGIGQLAVADQAGSIRRRSFILIVAGTLLVAIPLSLTTYQRVYTSLENREAIKDVNTWLEGTRHHVVSVNVGDRMVITTVEGSGELPPLRNLANRLAVTLKRPVAVNLRVLPSQVEASDK
jgi:uncharacterized hydrophobic protein (TIGR00271 family)